MERSSCSHLDAVVFEARGMIIALQAMPIGVTGSR